MPSSVTHYFFCEDVYKKINKKARQSIKDNFNLFSLFGQGPDPYFFYDFHLSKKSMEVYKINDAMQHSKTNKHFIKLINYINDNNFYDNEDIMAYLYGQICHFVLDSTCHPYIIYKTGIYDKDNRNTYKYNGKHEEMEYYIDIYLIKQRKGIPPKKFKVYKEIFKFNKFSNELIKTINDVNKEVYGFDDCGNIYYKSLKDMKKFYYIFNYDPTGIKKMAYSCLDFIGKDKYVKKRELSFNVAPDSKLYLLNNEHSIWNNPCILEDKYNYSFEDLYNISIKKATNIINEVNNMLDKKVIDNNKIKDLFKNLHYGTGKDCDLNLTYKYFDY